ncbi:hypothetical protein [Streptomyces sp. NPDC002845]
MDRLVAAQTLLPPGLRLLVLTAHRPPATDAQARLCAGHETGAAADLTLCTMDGVELWLGPEGPHTAVAPSRAACPPLDPVAVEHRRSLGDALSFAGLTNYPDVWWHWSYGDRYWAHLYGSDHARYGPLEPV